jgi:hypothetical protein
MWSCLHQPYVHRTCKLQTNPSTWLLWRCMQYKFLLLICCKHFFNAREIIIRNVTTYISALYVFTKYAGRKGYLHKHGMYYICIPSKMYTTGHSSFAVCLRHSTKTILHSAKALPSVTLGKERSANSTSASVSLPSTFCRALGKEFAECHLTLGKEKSLSRR